MRNVLIPAALLALPVTAHAETAEDQTIVVTGQGLERTAEDDIYGVQVIARDRIAGAASGRRRPGVWQKKARTSSSAI